MILRSAANATQLAHGRWLFSRAEQEAPPHTAALPDLMADAVPRAVGRGGADWRGPAIPIPDRVAAAEIEPAVLSTASSTVAPGGIARRDARHGAASHDAVVALAAAITAAALACARFTRIPWATTDSAALDLPPRADALALAVQDLAARTRRDALPLAAGFTRATGGAHFASSPAPGIALIGGLDADAVGATPGWATRGIADAARAVAALARRATTGIACTRTV